MNAKHDADIALRLARLSDQEMVLALREEAADSHLVPLIFPLEEGPVALAFSSEENLADFATDPLPYAALPCRAVLELLKAENLGMALDFGTPHHELLLSSADLDAWQTMLIPDVTSHDATPQRYAAPPVFPQEYRNLLQEKLRAASGLASYVLLAEAIYDTGDSNLLIAVIGAPVAAQPALANALSVPANFTTAGIGRLDIAFWPDANSVPPALAKVAHKMEIPTRQEPARHAPAPPGSDPAKPPRLR